MASGHSNPPRDEPRLTQANVKQLQAYHWPGNVRELQNIIERAVIVGTGGRLEFDLPGKASAPTHKSGTVETEYNTAQPFNEQERLARDRSNIIATLEMTGGKVSGKEGAAELLGIKSTTLASRIASLGIEKSSTNAQSRTILFGVLRVLVVHCYASGCKVPQRTPHKLLKIKEI